MAEEISERKAGNLTGPARIGRVTYSKTGATIYYGGRVVGEYLKASAGFRNERQALLDANLPDDDPAVLAWEDRVTASNLIFYLGVTACDDFSAVLILAGNGAGFAAFVHVRSRYERLVTALYLAKKPRRLAASRRVLRATS